MSDLEYTPRPYPHIVRDLLTTLTGGTVREAVTAPVAGPLQLNQLASRPIRRISHLEGVTDVAGTPVPVRFTNADFDLADADNDGLPDVVVFRDNGRKPIPGTTLTVNYYPTQIARPVPLTDLNVGSVARTVLETFAREIAQDEQYLNLIYRSAFLDTAEGSGLDKVVALIGVTRLPARRGAVQPQCDNGRQDHHPLGHRRHRCGDPTRALPHGCRPHPRSRRTVPQRAGRGSHGRHRDGRRRCPGPVGDHPRRHLDRKQSRRGIPRVGGRVR